MGSQIQIAQTPEDERQINQVLLKKFDLICLPRPSSSSTVQPERLGDCEGTNLVIFDERFRALVMKNIRPVSGKTGQYHVFPRAGLCIEWNRTTSKAKGFIAGRYYFDAADPEDEESASALKKVFALITRTVKKTYPLKTEGRYPIFVGPDLAKRIDAGEASLIYPDGTVMQTVENSVN